MKQLPHNTDIIAILTPTKKGVAGTPPCSRTPSLLYNSSHNRQNLLQATFTICTLLIPLLSTNLHASCTVSEAQLELTRTRDLDTVGTSFFNQRSQGQNTAITLAGTAWMTYRYDLCTTNGFVTVIPEYTRSTNRDALGKYFFFSCTNRMNFGPAATTPNHQDSTNVWNEQFLLNQDFQGYLQAEPYIENALARVFSHVNLTGIIDGLYIQLMAPFCWTRFNMNLEQITQTRGTTISANLLGNDTAQPAPFNNVIDAFNGDATFADVNEPLMFGRINGAQSKGGIANPEFIIGYRPYQCDYYHFGINARFVFPTGNRSRSIYLFEPILGNGHHAQIGGGIEGHLHMWDVGEHQTLKAYMDVALYHPLPSQQVRTFDLRRNGPGSRYLMFKRFTPEGEYADQMIRGTAITTLSTDVTISIIGDASFMLEYKNKGITLDLGFNIWGRTRERLYLNEGIPVNTYGVAGATGTAGEGRNKTASTTRISGAVGRDANGNPIFADDRIVYTNTDDLALDSAAALGALSYKIFGSLGYVWKKCYVAPFVGLGFEAEFSGRDNRALRQYGVWIKGGIELT